MIQINYKDSIKQLSHKCCYIINCNLCHVLSVAIGYGCLVTKDNYNGPVAVTLSMVDLKVHKPNLRNI